MSLRKAIVTDGTPGDWFIWSINLDDNTVSCLPYDQTDEESMFVWDLKHFPIHAISNAVQ